MSLEKWEATVLAAPGARMRVAALEEELRSAARLAGSEERDDTSEASAVTVWRSCGPVRGGNSR
jgi:hypothetical protein